MDIAYLSALSALAGSVVGGLTLGIATWLSQRAQVKAGELAREFSRRDELYKEFIIAASRAHGDALVSSDQKIPELVALYAMISRMRIQSSPRTVACAEKIMYETIETYFAPNKTARERYEMLKNGTSIDVLKAFSEVAREELAAFAAS
jgi:hypothetical protein